MQSLSNQKPIFLVRRSSLIPCDHTSTIFTTTTPSPLQQQRETYHHNPRPYIVGLQPQNILYTHQQQEKLTIIIRGHILWVCSHRTFYILINNKRNLPSYSEAIYCGSAATVHSIYSSTTRETYHHIPRPYIVGLQPQYILYTHQQQEKLTIIIRGHILWVCSHSTFYILINNYIRYCAFSI